MSYDLNFKNGDCEVYIHNDNDYGYFEVGQTEDDYIEGGLWFEEKALVDFDGCYALPKVVRDILIKNGYEVDEDFCL